MANIVVICMLISKELRAPNIKCYRTYICAMPEGRKTEGERASQACTQSGSDSVKRLFVAGELTAFLAGRTGAHVRRREGL